MIALDANVVLRMFVADDESQTRAVVRLWTRARRNQTALFIPDAVLLEIVWVLRSEFRYSRANIADTLKELLDTELVVVTNPSIATYALEAYRSGRGDFADYFIREQAKLAGAEEVVTFDKALKAEQGFRLLV